MNIPEGIKKTAVLVILRSEGKYLLLKRERPPNKGLYTPVGGKLDPIETPHAAAIRETFEETGIALQAVHYCGTLVETSPAPYNWISFVFVADIPFQEAPPCSEGMLQWIPQSQLADIPTPETDWHIYQYIDQDKKFHFDAHYNADLKLLYLKEEINDLLILSK
jgi:8-oxo-dGTP diphosphatase